MYLILLPLTLLSILTLILLFTLRSNQTRKFYPPGPKGHWLFGHLWRMPKNPQVTFQEWSKQFNSDVLYIETLKQPIVILNSLRSASHLLEVKGSNFCDRPNFRLFKEVGFRETLTMLRSGPTFRAHRKILQSYFNRSNVSRFNHILVQEARTLVKNLLESSNPDFNLDIRRAVTSIVTTIVYGHTVKSNNDPYIKIAEDAAYVLTHTGPPGGTMIDFLPIIKYLPDRLTWDKHLKFARKWKGAIRKLFDEPFIETRKKMTEGKAQESFMHDMLEAHINGSMENFGVDDIKGASGAAYIAGQDTTHAAVMICLLNLLLYPEIVKKAQEEIDRVVGKDRLPEFEDRDSLPYCSNIVYETMRYQPVSPLGVPHRSLQDEVYNGMLIPKGSVIFANAWAMCHDEEVYAKPSEFDPTRYFPKEMGGRNEPIPVGQFGFGRRVCVGRHLAVNSLWIIVVTLLATLNVQRPKDEDGNEIVPEVEFTSGLSSHPKAFKCDLKPRSKSHVDLVLNSTL